MEISEGLTYGDVLIRPNYSDIRSRSEIDLTTNFLGLRVKPIISSPMDHVSGYAMVSTLANNGYYGILHRFASEDDLVKQAYSTAFLTPLPFGISVGVKNPEDTFKWLNRLNGIQNQIHSICIDVAHGDHVLVLEMIKRITEWAFNQAIQRPYIIAGNIATGGAYAALAVAGADAVRVGIGSGSACTTRATTGVGVPQLTAIMDCVKAREWNTFSPIPIIGDGGIESAGDIVKSLAAGADMVMLGKLLAGHDESPGETIVVDGKKMKPYRGQSMIGANAGSPEGIAGLVPYRGPVMNTLNQMEGWIKSGFSYVGARDLTELRRYARFIKVSPATQLESNTRIMEI